MEEVVIPFPSPERTPPVTTMKRVWVTGATLRGSSVKRFPSGGPSDHATSPQTGQARWKGVRMVVTKKPPSSNPAAASP